MNNTQTQPQIIIASESLDFRRLAREKITREDFFLEIGCSFGECTRLLAEMGCSGLAVDNSASAVAQVREALKGYSTISIVQADARDMAHIHRLCPTPSVILFDIGGNEPLDKVTSLLRLALKTFRPRLFLVRSMELAELSSMVEAYYLPNFPHLLADWQGEDSTIPHQLLDLSRSPIIHNRLFALKHLRHSTHHPEVWQQVKAMRHDESARVRRSVNHILEHHRPKSRDENGLGNED